LRNPVICKIFREAGYVEKLGTGFITIFKSYEKECLEDPKIIEGENYVKVILPRFKKRKFERKKDELTKLFAFSDEISIEDVQKMLGVSRATASRKMNQWLKKGLVKRIGKTRALRYKKK
jgi:predicted HTH transcriptional regulator